jgi:outer membrane protein OmpA-like peptidoglycan-associated protein
VSVRALVGAFAALLAACATEPQSGPASRDRVILLQSSDGSVGAVDVRQGTQSALLDAPYASAGAGGDGTLSVVQADAAATREQFAAALAALPPAPVSYTVFFVFGQDELTDESRKAFAPVLDDVARRPAPEITVTGHADQVGAERINDALSLRRAERVKEMLVQRGVSAQRVTAAGRGAREPLVRGTDGTAEARNRRVEISIR